MRSRLILRSTLKLSLASLALVQSLGASHAKAETLPDIRDDSALCLAQKNPLLKESLFPLDDAIRTNQVGMQPNQAKLVVFAGQLSGAPEFQIADERGRSVFSGRLEHFGLDSDSGEELWRGNFTAFRLKGTYRVGISGRGYSHPFE